MEGVFFLDSFALFFFGFCWLFALFNISKSDKELYRTCGFGLALALGDFCFSFFLLLLLCCWWWWRWKQPGLHAWGEALRPPPQHPSSFEISI